MGEISLRAYNTGVGWRQIVEKMHLTATLTKWCEAHGRHRIFAGHRAVPLASTDHSLVLDPEAVAAGAQTDLDEPGVATTAREERIQARKNTPRTPAEERHHAEMARPYVQLLRSYARQPDGDVSPAAM